jgi:hypothetical protein
MGAGPEREANVRKYDVKQVHRELYSPPSADFVVVEVPETAYLAVDGHGDPNVASAYAEAVEALYGVAYTVKFESKNALGRDFVVAPLEGLWRADDPTAFVSRDKSAWNWTMLINQPAWISEDLVRSATEKVIAKKKAAAAGRVRLVRLHEGTSVQIMHHGSYDDEGPTLARLHDDFMPSNGLAFNGDHHEIYLSDPRRTAPARLRTILRQPVIRAAGEARA